MCYLKATDASVSFVMADAAIQWFCLGSQIKKARAREVLIRGLGLPSR